MYIDGIAPDSVTSIVSPSTISDSAMLAQMVSAIKQKLFSVATELVSSALKGGDRQVAARAARDVLAFPRLTHPPPEQCFESGAVQTRQHSCCRCHGSRRSRAACMSARKQESRGIATQAASWISRQNLCRRSCRIGFIGCSSRSSRFSARLLLCQSKTQEAEIGSDCAASFGGAASSSR